MKTTGVMHMLLVQDMNRSIEFYEQAFGFVTQQKSDFWSNLDCGRGRIALCTFGKKSDLKETTLIIEVDDHLQAIDRINQYGGRIVSVAAPYPGAPVYNVVFIDTENNQVVASQTVSV